jgi:flap endonuclease-1
MGISIKELIDGKEIEIKQLANKIIFIDTPVLLYQFLTTIRQADGSYLTDSKGNVTSHLVGINSRITRLIQSHLKLVFVFDGKSPELKREEQNRRREIKEESEAKYKIAMERKDITEMKKYAARSVKITNEIIYETKELIAAFGLPIVQAPSEAEAQASYMVKKGDGYAVATQDTDALMFGCPRIVKNLSLIGKHKRSNKLEYQTYKPELLELDHILNKLGIDHEQLVLLSILVGTDFNYGGVKGIGPKNALKIVKEYKSKSKIIELLKGRMEFDFDEVYNTIKNVPITDDYKLEWKSIDFNKIHDILVIRHDFSEERVNAMLKELQEYSETKKQTALSHYFG